MSLLLISKTVICIVS